MNEGNVDFLQKRAKTCFVLLESLDQRVLDQYLRKEESRVSCESTMKEHKKGEKYESRSVKGPSEKALKDYFKRRRKKARAKPLHYTDDEDECTGASPKENIWGKSTADKLSPPKSETMTKENGTPTVQENPDSNGCKKSDGAERNGMISANILKISLYKTASADEQPKSDVRSFEATFPKSRESFPKKRDRVAEVDIDDYNLGRVKSEVDVVEELGKCGSFKTELNRDESGKEWEWEAEQRDEDEDDKATVIFEKSLNNSVAEIEEALELTEEKVESVKKKFRKKKIMNRKKRTLVKFKRKRSLIGRNLAKVKKLKTKCSETIGSSQEPAEKESVSERNVREVCALVKRLHELYRIILQLQKDLPVDAKQADYLIETVNAQQRNFYKEIKKSQKIIMRGYDKMLSSFGSASTVSLEIGKRTSLSKEDIANVISKCTLGGPENRKRAAGTPEHELKSSREVPLGSLGAGPNSKKVKKPDERGESLQAIPQPAHVEMLTQESLGSAINHPEKNPASGSENAEGTTHPNMILRTPFFGASGHPRPSKSLQRPNNEPETAKEVEGIENHPTTQFLHLPSNSFRASQPFRNSFQGQWSDQSKPRPHFVPLYNCTPRAPVAYREPRFRQFPQHDPRDVHGNQVRPLSSRPVHNYSSNIRAQYRGNNGFPDLCTTVVGYPPNKNSLEFIQVPGGFVPPAPPMAGPDPRLPIPSLMDINPYPQGYSQGRLPPNHFPQVPCSLAQGAGIAHFDRPRHHAPIQNAPHKNPKTFNHSTKYFNNFGRRNNFPPSRSSESSVSGAPKEGYCPLNVLLSNFSRFLPPNAPTRTCAVAEPAADPDQTDSPSTDPEGSSESPILDPTVPQKLTMRNHRLEAGPILKPKSDGSKSEKDESFPDVREASAPVAPDGSREYVCAQNGCKNPGVRICKGCLSIIYCSETCQLKHWTLKHKMECHQLKELRG